MTAPQPTAEPAVSPSRPGAKWLVLAGVWLVYFSFGLVSVGLAPLVAPIARDLDLSYAAMGGVLGIWQLVYIASAVPCGVLLDRLGSGRALFLGAMLIAASGLCRSLAVDYLTLCLAVALFGLGGPIISAGAPKVVSQWFTGSTRGFAMGVYMTGPAIGGVLVLSLTNAVLMPWLDNDWRGVMKLLALVAALGGFVWLAVSFHPEARGMERRLNAEPRLPQRQVLGSLLSLPAVRLVLAMSVGIFMFSHGLGNWLPEILRSGGMTATQAGYWSALPTAIGIFGALMIPRLAIPRRRFTVLILLCSSAVLCSLCLHATTGPFLVAGLALQGIVRSSLMTVTILVLVEMRGVGDKYAGTAGGLFFSAAEVGGASGPMLLGVLYDATGGFDAGLYLLATISTLLLLGAVWLRQMVGPRAAG